MKGTQSGPARCASISSSQPTHPHQCTINENLFHSASPSTHAYFSPTFSASLNTRIQISSFHDELFFGWHNRGCKLSFTFHSEFFKCRISHVHVCSANMSEWHRGMLRERESKCVALTERQGSQSLLNRTCARACTACQTLFHLLGRAAH